MEKGCVDNIHNMSIIKRPMGGKARCHTYCKLSGRLIGHCTSNHKKQPSARTMHGKKEVQSTIKSLELEPEKRSRSTDRGQYGQMGRSPQPQAKKPKLMFSSSAGSESPFKSIDSIDSVDRVDRSTASLPQTPHSKSGRGGPPNSPTARRSSAPPGAFLARRDRRSLGGSGATRIDLVAAQGCM